MLKTHEKLVLQDLTKTNPVIFEVNWRPEDKEINECKVIRINIGGKEAVIDRDYLIAAVFTFGSPQQQIDLIPQRQVTKRRFEGQVELTATKDIKKGEKIYTTCRHDLPAFVEDVYGPSGGAQSAFSQPNNLILPK